MLTVIVISDFQVEVLKPHDSYYYRRMIYIACICRYKKAHF